MRRRVLLVGGDPQIVAVLHELFKWLRGDDYEVEAVDFCDDALAMLRQRPFHLILLLSLRVRWRTLRLSMSIPAPLSIQAAIVFLRQMRALHSAIPVLVLSGSDRADTKEEVLRTGAFAFVPKPVDLREIDRLVALALSHEEVGPPRSK